MKKLVIIWIILLPFFGYSDTLNYWSIYLNDSLIGQYNPESNNNQLVLSYDSITETDTISVVYGNDHPCFNCEYYYAMKLDFFGTKIHVEKRSKILETVSFPLLKLKKHKGVSAKIILVENSFTNTADIYTILFNIQFE